MGRAELTLVTVGRSSTELLCSVPDWKAVTQQPAGDA
ncbi:hypothetical protein Tter_2780 [Thermobaculum terrenum ATCC BAA-798]|uniref:Uncharacterized protein n=1 Tax=Thermobaculum terrenum (strain ATCC BAA-798 / CCMEE 7001 / YNP1) TaxID=525904 RepID=D1CIU5_THET1|nr:hypothetical protein Tter_2780 [Thermobaculum terrenum ATCC BAA-798]